MPSKVNVERDDAKMNAATAAASRKANSKKGKMKTKEIAVYAVGGFLCLLAVFLAVSGPSNRKGGNAKLEGYVNDAVGDANDKSEGNFTAAASPFFNKWTVADAKWGMSGVGVSNMIGISGAIQVCSGDDAVEGGVIPPSYDARDSWAGCFGEVRDSGNCSSSYANAAADALASRYCIQDNAKYGSLRLSAQQILSCDKKSRGCKGGGVDSVWHYIQKKGLYPEECVPYEGVKEPKCSKTMTTCAEDKKVQVLDHCVLTKEKSVKREIYNKGPVVAPIYLKNEYLVYSGGVYTPTENADTLFDATDSPAMHAVMLVGWGKSQGTPYWWVRHSWGSTWGENGYARVAMNSVVRDNYAITATPATEENVKAAEIEKVAADKRKEERKIERAERDERIREQRSKMEAEKSAEAIKDDDLKDLDDDFDDDVDLKDVDVDLDDDNKGPQVPAPAPDAEKPATTP